MLNNSGVNVRDEPFHMLRNKIIEDLKGYWASSTYWDNFEDKDLLQAVMKRMQVRNELLSRNCCGIYEWTVTSSAKPTKIALQRLFY